MGTDQLPEPLEPFAGFIGTWEGRGEGHYPTIEPFGYHEQVTFTFLGKPFLAYAQKTRDADTDRPLHAEVGYLRPGGAGRAELVVAQPTGITEIDEGPFDGTVMDLRTDSPGTSATAKQVRTVRRRFVLDADVLSYDMWMAYAHVDETHHLHAELHRVA